MHAWQVSALEPAIAPHIPIIDPHHHLWGEDSLGTPWVGRFTPDDLIAEIDRSGQPIIGTVYADCHTGYRTFGPDHMRCVGETETVKAVSEKYAGRRIALAMMGGADLLLGDSIQEVLEAHLLAWPGRFCGVRDLLASDPDLGEMLGNTPKGKSRDPRFRAAFARLEPLGLGFEAWCVHPQLGDIVELARAFPGTTIILNHLGSPLGVGRFAGKREQVLAEWKASMNMLAGCPNVVVKVGGLGMTQSGFWATGDTPPNSEAVAAAYKPFVSHVVDIFSPSRCMFESNFPVDGASYGYGICWNAFKRIAATYSKDEQRSLFSGTAARIYHLPELGQQRALGD